MPAVAIIQARMTSSRLRGKVLADLAGKPLLERMIERVRRSKRLSSIVVATTTNKTDDPVAALSERLGFLSFRGDEHDVLGRMHAAARQFGADPVVRLTADCPMSDPAVIDDAIALFDESGADYVSNCNRRTFPDGLDVEVFSADVLSRANDEARARELREHVTPYIRGNRPDLGVGNFRREDLVAVADFGHIRFTVDTQDDLSYLRSIFERLPDDFGWLDAVALASRHPESLRVTRAAASLAGIVIRPATLDDASALFRWLNEPDRRAVSLNGKSVTVWKDHLSWLAARLNHPDCHVALAAHDGIPVGYIRLDREPGLAFISLYIDGQYRGRKVGTMLVNAARDFMSSQWPGVSLTARVLITNPASIAFFQRNGFSVVEEKPDHYVLQHRSADGCAL